MLTIRLVEAGMNFDTLLGQSATVFAILVAVLITAMVMGVYWEG